MPSPQNLGMIKVHTQMSASIQRQSLTLQMVSHQKCNLAASSERQRNNYILKFSFHFHEIQFRTKCCTFLTHLNGRPGTLFVLLFRTFTGKSLSEALILASTNSQYGNRLFIELQIQYKQTKSSVHVVYTNCFFVLTFKTIHVHNMF